MTPVFHVLQPTPAVPWYIHPAQAPLAWQRLAEGAFGFGFVVVNIENGPGRGPQDPYYREPLARGVENGRASRGRVPRTRRSTEQGGRPPLEKPRMFLGLNNP